MKQFFFLSGLPRAGNTLLSTLLNQNPDILVTPNSVTAHLLLKLHESKQTFMYKNFPVEKHLHNVTNNLFHNFYSHLPQKYIIDRGAWGTPYNFSLLKQYLKQDIRIIFLVRDIKEILNSFIHLCENNPNFYINQQYQKLDKSTLYVDEIEAKCNLILAPDQMVDRQLYSLKHLIDLNQFKEDRALLIEYNQLISQPESTMEKVYRFLKIRPFKHSFVNLKKYEMNGLKYNDDYLGAPMHALQLDKISPINKIMLLSSRLINKYKNMEFWK